MLNDPRLKQAFQQYEKKQEERYSEQVWKQKHLSREAEERILNALRKQSRRLMWKRAFVRVGEGLAVAAVFCMMAYAVYLAAQGPEDPIVAGTRETETQTETVTSETTKTESEINPLYVRALENQASAIDRVLAEQKASGEDLYQEFVLTLIKNSTSNAQAVWNASNKMQAISNNILVSPYYSPTVLEIVLPELEKAYFSDHLNWAEELMSTLMLNRGNFPGVAQMKISGWNSNTQKEETFTVVEVRDILDKRKAELKLQAEINKINEEFQNAVDLIVKEENPSDGYRKFLRIDENYYYRIQPYTVGGFTATPYSFMELFEAKSLEYQKDPGFWNRLEKGDVFWLGSYEQDNNLENGAESILWRVLYRDGNKLYCRSAYVLDALPWNENGIIDAENPFRWDISTLRKWLNEDFYQAAFTEAEKARIALTPLSNSWYHDKISYAYKGIGTSTGGADTEDWVFIQAGFDYVYLPDWQVFSDVHGYFGWTDYAKAKGCTDDAVYIREESTEPKVGKGMELKGANGYETTASTKDPKEIHGVVPSIVIQIPNA